MVSVADVSTDDPTYTPKIRTQKKPTVVNPLRLFKQEVSDVETLGTEREKEEESVKKEGSLLALR